MFTARSPLVKLGAIITVSLAGVWILVPSEQPTEQAPKTVKASPQKATELKKRRVQHEPLSRRNIVGALKMPNTCQRPVMEVSFENGQAQMGVACQDGQLVYWQKLDLGLVDTTVPALDARGAAFAMSLVPASEIKNTASGLPPDEQQGVTVEVPIPNTCSLSAVELRFGGDKTIVRYKCLDAQSTYSKTIEMNIDLVNSTNLNKDRIPIVAIVLRDPDYVKQ